MRTEYVLLPDDKDKIAKSNSFRDRAMRGMVHFPKGTPWAARVIDQLVAFPAGRWDDAVDTCGFAGRGMDQMYAARKQGEEGKQGGIKPFTVEWLLATDPAEQTVPASYYR